MPAVGQERKPELWALDVQACAEELARVDTFAAEVFRRIYPQEAELLAFVLREAVLNALEAVAEEAMIQIRLSADEDGVEICVIDQGGGFERQWQDKLAETSMEDCLLEERGRGLLFISRLVDEVWSSWEPERGHVFGMRKKWQEGGL